MSQSQLDRFIAWIYGMPREQPLRPEERGCILISWVIVFFGVLIYGFIGWMIYRLIRWIVG